MKRALLSTLCACALLAALAAPAQAVFGLNNFEFVVEDENGPTPAQAGSHPFAVTNSFGFNYAGTGIDALPDAQPRNIEVELPPGFAGNPSAVPTCSHTDFLHLTDTGDPSCPNATAVGVIHAEILSPGPSAAPRAVFNLEHPPGAAAEIGFVVVSELVTIDFYVKQSPPYNVIAKITNTPQAAKIFGSKLTIWGNPANPMHDAERGNCILGSSSECPAEIEEVPFVTLPRACTGPLFTTYSALSWQGDEDHGSSLAPLETNGCSALGFAPEIEAQPSTTAAESSSGLDFEIKVDDPELTEPSGTADSDIKAINLTFPAGVTVNPSAGEGQAACTATQLAAETLSSQGCPEASKLGTVEVETPLLKGEVLGGSVYLADQNDNPFGSLLALYVVIKDPDLGVLVRQPIEVKPDPATGQLSSTVDNLPQLPFSSFRLHFRTGPRAPLVTPSTCGSYATEATLIPWASGVAPVKSSSSFKIDSNCRPPLPLGPAFTAGTRSNAASSYSPFDLRVVRADGEPELTRFSASLPNGLVGKLAGVSECSAGGIAAARVKTGRQELASPSCPASALIGHIDAGAGVGSALTYVPGALYLAGPYLGDPLSAVAIVPAIAGPLDVGNVVVRVPLTLDPATAQVKIDGAASEPFPRILAGIPLRLRDLRVSTDRPNFMINASGCEMKAVEAQIFGSAAAAFSTSSPYRASGCSSLGFNPKLSLSLTGQMKRAGHPKLHSELSYPYPSGPGYSNIGEAVVTLPAGVQIDNAHINNPCTRVQFSAQACPPKSILGSAKATSPLLDKPLEGSVYFRSNGGEHLLPDIVADLKGQVEIVLVGHVDAVKTGNGTSRLRTTFENVPDAPVTKFSLDLYGGKRGLLTNNRDLCKSTQKTGLFLLGQNNKLRESTPKLKTSCKSGKGKHRGK